MQDAASSAAAKPPAVKVVKDVNNNKLSSKQQEPAKLSASPSVATNSNSMITQHLSTLEHLDQKYQYLLGVEQTLQKHLDELQKEEQALREAWTQSSTTLKEQRESEMKKKEAEALARLEDALMNDDDDDDSDCTTGS